MEPAATPRLTWAVRTLRLLLHILSGLIQSAIYPHLGQSTQQRMAQRWCATLLRILNVRLRCTGIPPGTRRVMLVANHVSWLDIHALNAACPARFVAKAEIRSWPLFGWLSRNVGTLFIERTKRSDTARINADIAHALIQGDRVAIFPEGTTSDGTLLRHFHASLLQPAVAVAATLHPVAIRYTDTGGTPGRSAAFSEISLLESLRRVLRQPWIDAELTFISPVCSQGRNRRELARVVELAIAEALSLPLPHTAPGKSSDPPAAPP
ncbi:1-acyl-sn-glycerol-3-phosphate acyltransferase [Nitrosovibrio sp. Nv17]|uniref:lysophospholipid acyltransferase family protein n=1 Tax=Nitrosovibrio sp. Nv17 TaxID=1855339 RepID=UPI000908C278|nr:lysophospholipid acyltransferase family protein [Nitrosovibrio sp. Nv17]SFW33140.1 lyso-ornithine lipid acyltransferase [Nitrosovibrio sp. Nv17]